MLKGIILIILLAAAGAAHAAIYQCQHNGQTIFSDEPCGDDAAQITVEPVVIGGQLDTGTDVETYKPSKGARESRVSDCPFINSTDLRRYIIQNKVVRGMKPADVRRSWGPPSSVSTGRTTQWAYHYPDYSSRYVYFESGCVTNWNGYYRNE